MAIKRETPTGITLRARYFIRAHGHWADHADIEQYRARWTEHSIPTAQIDRVASYERVWGGLILPPSPHYDGGPGRSAAMCPKDSNPARGSSKQGRSARPSPTRS